MWFKNKQNLAYQLSALMPRVEFPDLRGKIAFDEIHDLDESWIIAKSIEVAVEFGVPAPIYTPAIVGYSLQLY